MKNILLIVSITALLTVTTSCKKKNTIPDNPNVYSSILDSSVLTPASSATDEAPIDVNKDGTSDFDLVAINDGGTLITKIVSGRTNTPLAFVIEDLQVGSSFDENAILDSSGIKPTPPKPHRQLSSSAILSFKSLSANIGHAGEGDFYIAFIIYIGGERHFGWLKLNVSSDGKTLKLRSYGYNIHPEESLKAGEF
jgi:hypothetical protein